MNIEVSRSMDEVIAAKVMGWERRPDDPPWFNSQGEVRNFVPEYSTDMYDSGLVMAKMAQRGMSWKIHHGKTGDGKPFVSAELVGPGGVFEVGSAESMEMAICLAALKVVDKAELY